MPRKPIPIDLEELEKLAAMHCTQQEVAAWFGITQQAVSKKFKQRVFVEVWEHGWARGNIGLRRTQKQRADGQGEPRAHRFTALRRPSAMAIDAPA